MIDQHRWKSRRYVSRRNVVAERRFEGHACSDWGRRRERELAGSLWAASRELVGNPSLDSRAVWGARSKGSRTPDNNNYQGYGSGKNRDKRTAD